MKKILVFFAALAIALSLEMGVSHAQQQPEQKQPATWVCPRTGQTMTAGQGPCCGRQGRWGRGGGRGWRCGGMNPDVSGTGGSAVTGGEAKAPAKQ